MYICQWFLFLSFFFVFASGLMDKFLDAKAIAKANGGSFLGAFQMTCFIPLAYVSYYGINTWFFEKFQASRTAEERLFGPVSENVRKIGEVQKIDPNRIICGAGSDEIIQLLCRCFCEKNDEVIYTEHGFLMYKLSALAAGARPVKVEEIKRTASIDNICAAITAKTKIIFLANPNNPTGTMISAIEIEQLLNQIPDNILLVLDGAYSEYVDSFDGGISLVNKFGNLFVTRTFSKIFGLGGLRVGWGYGARDIIDVLNSVRSPFNVSSLGLKMAELSIADVKFVSEQRELNIVNREMLRNRLLGLGLKIDQSFANFLLLRFVSEEQVNKIDSFLKERGFILRKVGSYGLPKCLRLSIGNKEICEKLYSTLEEYFD